jgi:predicted anti-sigma-YlaC factor YlaD
MVEKCSALFDEAMLSAYLDDELTQEESQPVRIHLEDCASCRRTYEQMRELREATMATPFPAFDDGQWDERPRSRLSRILRNVGWAVLLVWLGGVAFLALSELAAEAGGMPIRELALIVGLVGGGLLVFLSIVLDRLGSYKTDRYRRVQK